MGLISRVSSRTYSFQMDWSSSLQCIILSFINAINALPQLEPINTDQLSKYRGAPGKIPVFPNTTTDVKSTENPVDTLVKEEDIKSFSNAETNDSETLEDSEVPGVGLRALTVFGAATLIAVVYFYFNPEYYNIGVGLT